LPRRRWFLFTALLRSRGNVLPDRVCVGEALANDAAHGVNQPAHGFGLPVVEPEHLLIEVAEQVERLNANVDALMPRFNRLQKFSSPLGWTLPLA
jgi:hypothetical protein